MVESPNKYVERHDFSLLYVGSYMMYQERLSQERDCFLPQPMSNVSSSSKVFEFQKEDNTWGKRYVEVNLKTLWVTLNIEIHGHPDTIIRTTTAMILSFSGNKDWIPNT